MYMIFKIKQIGLEVKRKLNKLFGKTPFRTKIMNYAMQMV